MTVQQGLLPQISHDLRNYLGGISGLANMISEKLKHIQETQSHNKSNQNSSFRAELQETLEFATILAPYSAEALNYVDDLLDFTQFETEKFTLKKVEDCDLKELVKRLLVFNKGFISDHKITVETDIEENLPKLRCDVLRLKQILINLVTNAVKYSSEGSKVGISIRSLNKDDKKQIHIEISDTGIGMSEEEVKMALSGEGQNINKSNLNKPIDSHGLGMSIVKQLLELMDATMEIKSEKGKGTKISLYFNCN